MNYPEGERGERLFVQWPHNKGSVSLWGKGWAGLIVTPDKAGCVLKLEFFGYKQKQCMCYIAQAPLNLSRETQVPQGRVSRWGTQGFFLFVYFVCCCCCREFKKNTLCLIQGSSVSLKGKENLSSFRGLHTYLSTRQICRHQRRQANKIDLNLCSTRVSIAVTQNFKFQAFKILKNNCNK